MADFPGQEALAQALSGLPAWWLREAGAVPLAIEAVSRSTGWPLSHAREAVRRAFLPFTPAAVRALVRSGAGAGDRPGRLLAILAGPVPAVAVNALFWSLAARVPVTLKPPSAEPLFARLLVESVRDAAPSLAPFVDLLDLPSGHEGFARAVRDAPACLAYGGDAATAAVTRMREGRPTFVGHHRESFVILSPESLRDDRRAAGVARAVAADVAIYDQSGCLSPHAVLVPQAAAIAPDALGRMLHQALLDIESLLPPAPLAVEDLAAIRLFVEEARVLGARVSPEFGRVPPAVLVHPEGLPARPGPGLRVVQVLPFRGTPDLARVLPHLAGRVQGVAIAGERRVAAAAFDACPEWRPCRTCAVGRLQRPPAAWRENGIVLTRVLARGAGRVPRGGCHGSNG